MPSIDSVKYGEVTVGGKTFYSDLVLWWDSAPRPLEKTHLLDLPLLKRILKPGTESLVVGVGMEGTVRLALGVRKALEKKKIRLFVDRTENAAEIYNAFAYQGKKAVAILHVTL